MPRFTRRRQAGGFLDWLFGPSKPANGTSNTAYKNAPNTAISVQPEVVVNSGNATYAPPVVATMGGKRKTRKDRKSRKSRKNTRKDRKSRKTTHVARKDRKARKSSRKSQRK